MSSMHSEQIPEPDDAMAVWVDHQRLIELRAQLAELEQDLMMKICKLEQTGISPVALLKICAEPLIVARALQLGRWEFKRSFEEIYEKTRLVAEGINHEKKEGPESGE